MTNTEKVRELLDELKKCPVTDISKYFAPVIDLIRFLPKEHMNECRQTFYTWAEETASEEPLKFSYAEFLVAMIHFILEDYEAALPLLTKAQKEFEQLDDEDGHALCSVLIGAIYRTFGNFELALKILWEAYELLKRSGNYLVPLAASAYSIASIDFEMYNYEEALLMFVDAYETSKKAHDYYFLIYALQGIAKVNMQQQKYAEAREVFEKALRIAREHESPMHIANSFTELANFYCHSGNFAEAERLNKQSLAIREEHQFTLGVITNYVHLGEIYIRQSELEEALQVLNKGLLIAEQTKVKPKIYHAHFLLSEVYESKMDFEKSLYHFKLFHNLREQVEEEDYSRKLSDARKIFEAEQTKKENVIIKKQKEEIQRKNTELQETIDELTLTKVSRKAKAVTLVIAIVLFILQDFILGYVLNNLPSDSYFLSLLVKIGIIFSLNPINNGVEHYLLKKVIRNKQRNKETIACEPVLREGKHHNSKNLGKRFVQTRS